MADTPSFIPKRAPSGITRRPEVRRQPIDKFIILPSIVLLISFLLAGSIFLYRRFLENRIDDLNTNLRRIEGQFEAPLINELTRISKEIEAAKLVLASHVENSEVFDFLESYIHPDVYFTSLTFDGATATLSGEAPSYTALAEQMKLFESSGVIKLVRISNLGLKETGQVSFDIALGFDISIFHYQP
ncbi:MAG: hypothetical protein COU47_01980 [Candidatus Niyogibacteria bacterium CG10_big_fil_rev_8_21_14_0_10_46_36]|uniref:PilN domain-containing protein n=1 Tax=Candidatus Niyogibacteria bacterium CG10_big_fil_rev_8_21_14_0_10_46_36 TaxID=1974726 RepID=A0A2H0TDN2_9BACT|nr:MAG: hypothetical protein COU47_01980 [Candidatus Niyogibacteria bacterium CG10_big_fil_rev_8_21_14_0_10_46_36]